MYNNGTKVAHNLVLNTVLKKWGWGGVVKLYKFLKCLKMNFREDFQTIATHIKFFLKLQLFHFLSHEISLNTVKKQNKSMNVFK